MLELVAESSDETPRSRSIRVQPTRTYIIGISGDLVVDWDPHIGERHISVQIGVDEAILIWDPSIVVAASGTQPPSAKLRLGESFALGRTKISFDRGDRPRAIATGRLDRVESVDAEHQLRVLANVARAIRKAADVPSLYHEMLRLVLQGIPRASATAIVQIFEDTDPMRLEVLSSVLTDVVDPRMFRPSRRFAYDTVYNKRLPQVRNREQGPLRTFNESADDVDWAICVPIPSDRRSGLALYLEGRTTTEDLQGGKLSVRTVQDSDVKFASIVAQFIGSLQLSIELQSDLHAVGQFLPGPVLDLMRVRKPDEVFRTTEADVTFLFCDLRNSSRIAEAAHDENELSRAWHELNDFLSIFTSAVVDHGGIIEDLEGDAVKGFWGWPIPCDDQIGLAVAAASRICTRFDQLSTHLSERVRDVSFGIGIATGKAVVGRLGTDDQFKISVFGPVPNRAARLEGMTKKFHTRVLVDGEIHRWLESRRATASTRRIARVCPAGMDRVVDVCELTTDARERSRGLFQKDRDDDFYNALHHFQAGRWQEARELLEDLHNDGPAGFLLNYMAERGFNPPPQWDGIIRFDTK